MSAVAPQNCTYAQIELLVRRLTASSSESALPSADIQETVNDFYMSDFPYAIKLDVLRSVYTFWTRPYIDRYPLDVNYNQGVRAPMYVEGIQGSFFKDRNEFYNMWPRWPTRFNPINGDGVTQVFNFTIPGPFLSREVALGGTDVSGAAISVNDDGNGNLQLKVPNPVVSVPLQTTTPPVPGMYNLNTANPGLETVTNIGTVNYVTGVFSINFALGSVTPAIGTQMTLWVSQYQTGRPYSLLFWNNEFTIRPVPKLIHKVEVETYLTPVQFMLTTDTPILNQFTKYLAYGTACEIMRQRQDMDGLANLMEGFKRQEALVLERQGTEEINSRNQTIFASAQQTLGWNNGFMQGWGG
jgi:hypothetical protein